MPFLISGLDSGDRKMLYIVGGVLLLVFTLIVVAGPSAESQSNGIPSSHSYASDGACAAYFLLKDSGYNLERWQGSPTELPQDPTGVVLILADPIIPPSDEERRALRSFIEKGGSVLATGPAGGNILPEGSARPSASLQTEWLTFAARMPSAITRDAPEIQLPSTARWRAPSASHAILYGDEQQPVVVSYAVKEGRAVWWASSVPLTNAGISASHNLELFLNSVGQPKGARVLWDEYYHGERGSIWTYLAGTPVPWALLQLGLVAFALVFTFGRRSGPVRAAAVVSRLSPLEFVESLGGLYQRAGAAPAVLGVAGQRFRFLLTRRLGLPAITSAAELGRVARERLGPQAAGAGEALARVEQAAAKPAVSNPQALAMVQALGRYTERLELGPGAVHTVRGKEKSSKEKR
jgi:hypothetical protein